MTRTLGQRRGDAGERFAEQLVESWGWTVLDRNWRGGSGEIDVIALDEGCLVFVEVKLRSGRSFGTAEESLSRAKQDRLLILGQEYLEMNEEYADALWRIDLIALTLSPTGSVDRLTHVPNACESDW